MNQNQKDYFEFVEVKFWAVLSLIFCVGLAIQSSIECEYRLFWVISSIIFFIFYCFFIFKSAYIYKNFKERNEYIK